MRAACSLADIIILTDYRILTALFYRRLSSAIQMRMQINEKFREYFADTAKRIKFAE